MSRNPEDAQAPMDQAIALQAERLVQAIAAGDRAAENDFVQRYQRPVRAMLIARSRDPDLAADLQQEVLIGAICALRRGQLLDPSKLTAYVLSIARNVLNNHFRSQSTREEVELPDDLPDLSRSAERAEDEEREGRALQAISRLEIVDRTILQLTLVDGLKPGAIAARLRLSSDVVRQRKVRATRRVIEFVRDESQSAPSSHIATESVIP
jgi:RNA polymerase sigma factor (sigma-70 family)